MNPSKQRSKRDGVRRTPEQHGLGIGSKRRYRPEVERFEKRELLTCGPLPAATGVICGSVSIGATGQCNRER